MAETDLTLKFKVQDDGSIQLDKFSGKLAEVPKHVDKISSSLNLIKWDSLVNLGERAFRAGEQIYNLAKEMASLGSEIQRNSTALGMNTSEYQKWVYVAKAADVETEQFLKGIRSLTNTMNESPDKISKLGISVKAIGGNFKTIDEILPEIIQKLSSTGDVTRQNAIAMDLFGTKSGMAFANLVREGKNITEIKERFEEMNLEISEETIKNLAASEQAFKNFGFTMQKVKVEALTPAVVIFGSMLERIMAIKKALSEGGIAGAFEDIVEAQKEAGVEALPAAEWTKEWVKEYQPKKGIGGVFSPENEIAVIALNKALEKTVSLAKGASDEISNINKAFSILERLGVKTRAGAEKEIAAIMQDFETLKSLGLEPEEMKAAKTKLEEELKTVESKYKTESGWKATGEEGGVRWWSNIVPKEGIGGDISKMVTEAVSELNRMQTAAEAATGPKTIMIDYTPVQSANEAALKLRDVLNEIDKRVITVTINQKLSGDVISDVIERVDEGMTTRFSNKQSRFGSIVRKEIEGTIYYGNE